MSLSAHRRGRELHCLHFNPFEIVIFGRFPGPINLVKYPMALMTQACTVLDVEPALRESCPRFDVMCLHFLFSLSALKAYGLGLLYNLCPPRNRILPEPLPLSRRRIASLEVPVRLAPRYPHEYIPAPLAAGSASSVFLVKFKRSADFATKVPASLSLIVRRFSFVCVRLLFSPFFAPLSTSIPLGGLALPEMRRAEPWYSKLFHPFSNCPSRFPDRPPNGLWAFLLDHIPSVQFVFGYHSGNCALPVVYSLAPAVSDSN